MAFDAVGKLHVAYETKQVSERFTKREFVVEIADGKYPQFVLFQLTGDRCSLLDEHKVGDNVRVTFNVRGREWRSPQGETKYFNSLDVWKLEAARPGAGAPRSGRRSAPTSRVRATSAAAATTTCRSEPFCRASRERL
jgi:single-strand DNA-binding protein